MNVINYSQNWNNKLFCDAWSTIRLANSSHYQLLKLYEHRLIKKDGQFSLSRFAKLMYIKEFRLEDLGDPMSLMDCGLSWRQCDAMIRTMYKSRNLNWETQKLYYMVFSSKHIY